MVKVITLKCSGCGATTNYVIGAGPQLATLKDALARIPGKKDTDEIIKQYMKISERKSQAAMNEFSSNPAEVLENIAYDACSEEKVGLFEPESDAVAQKFFTEKQKEGFHASVAKWDAAFAKEGIVAFQALYLCPKTRHPQQGLYLSMHWTEDKKERHYHYRNLCLECGTPLVLIDDRNAGFMHEDLKTIARCSKCNAPLVVERVSFRVTPTAPAQSAGSGQTPPPTASV